MSAQIALYAFYLALIAMSGLGEYFLHFPQGSTLVLIGGVFGHGIATIPNLPGLATNGTTTTSTTQSHSPIILPPPGSVS